MPSELAQKCELHPNQIALWKKELEEGAEGLFETARGPKPKEEPKDDSNELYEQIGRLKMENEWLKKKLPK